MQGWRLKSGRGLWPGRRSGGDMAVIWHSEWVSKEAGKFFGFVSTFFALFAEFSNYSGQNALASAHATVSAVAVALSFGYVYFFYNHRLKFKATELLIGPLGVFYVWLIGDFSTPISPFGIIVGVLSLFVASHYIFRGRRFA